MISVKDEVTLLEFFNRTENVLDYSKITFEVGRSRDNFPSVLSWDSTGIDLTYNGSVQAGRITRRDMDLWSIWGLRRKIFRGTGVHSTVLEIV